jgi:hypothetical protein
VTIHDFCGADDRPIRLLKTADGDVPIEIREQPAAPVKFAPPTRGSHRAGPRREARELARAATELGNAERLVDQHGERIRHCAPLRTWLAWDDARWAPDEFDELERLSKATIRGIYREAEKASDRTRRTTRSR